MSASDALDCLRLAVSSGFKDPKRLATDDRFERVRPNRDFQALVADLVVAFDPFTPRPAP